MVLARVVVVTAMPSSERYRRRLRLLVVAEVKAARDQHGLKHHDYGRYRSYLTKRLRRLYKTLGLTHGKGKKYVARPIELKELSLANH